METLAIIAVVLICASCLGLQHLFNYWLRQDFNDTPVSVFGFLGIVLSIFILAVTIVNAIQIF